MKLSRFLRLASDNTLIFYCAGCKDRHAIRVGPGQWSWNGDAEKPVFGPSIRVDGMQLTPEGERMLRDCERPVNGVYPSVATVCHSFVGCNGAEPGYIKFLADCTHELRDTVQPMAEFPVNASTTSEELQ